MGPLWFAWALILLTLVWVVWTGTMSRAAPRSASPQAPVPRGRAWLLSAALLVGVAALTIRQWFPVGQNVLGLQLGYFAPYVFLFLLGARASVSRWLLFSSRLRKCPRNHAETEPHAAEKWQFGPRPRRTAIAGFAATRPKGAAAKGSTLGALLQPTPGNCALFQAAINTVILQDIRTEQAASWAACSNWRPISAPLRPAVWTRSFFLA